MGNIVFVAHSLPADFPISKKFPELPQVGDVVEVTPASHCSPVSAFQPAGSKVQVIITEITFGFRVEEEKKTDGVFIANLATKFDSWKYTMKGRLCEKTTMYGCNCGKHRGEVELVDGSEHEIHNSNGLIKDKSLSGWIIVE